MKRIVSVITVAAVMAAIMAAMAMPAWADSPWTEEQGECTTKQGKPGLSYEREGTNKYKEKCFVDPVQFDKR